MCPLICQFQSQTGQQKGPLQPVEQYRPPVFWCDFKLFFSNLKMKDLRIHAREQSVVI